MKNLKEKLFLLSFIIFSSFITAQEMKLSGKVVDAEDQMPLIGASVVIQGTSKGSATDFDGIYTITAKSGDVLVFSYLGYEDIKITVGSSATINASLKVQADALNEVVVVAYGTTTKKVLTGAQATIKSETFKDRPVVTIEDALQGNASGLLIQSASGQPGGAANISIRGVGSLSGSTQPLVVIDGFPVEEVQRPGDGSPLDNSAQISPFAFINPNDIESVEVLKDASATALYGIRGANGVILITTKKGKPGNTKFNYSTYLGVRNVPNQLDMMNFSQYVEYAQDRTPDNALFTASDNTPYNFDPNVPSINWQDRLYRTGIVQDHSLSVQGGAENTRYLLSGSFLQDKSVIIETDFKKYNLRLNIDQKVSDKFKFGTTLAYNFIANKGLPTDGREGTATGTVMTALITRPYILADSDTQAYFRRAGVPQSQLNAFSADGTGTGPEHMARVTDIFNRSGRFMSSAWAHWNITKELTLKLFAGNDMFNGKDQQFYPRTTGWGFNAGGVAVNAEFLNRSWSTENVLNYKTQFYNHKFDIDLGGTLRENRFEWWRSENSFFGTEALGFNRLENAMLFRNASMLDMNKFIGFLGRMNYSFKDKILLTFSNRYDGSSRFVKDKWQSFPSMALAYNLGEEAFLKNNKSVNLLKIRGSIGEVGNSQVPNTGAFAIIDRTNYTFNGVEVPGQSRANLANSNLSWETTVQMNGGIDLNLFANTVTITADYYLKRTRDLLLNTPIPNVVGFDDAWQNIGEVQNSGVEFSLTTINMKTDNFEWNTSFNITTNTSRINKLGNNGQPIYIDVNFDEIIKDEVILQEGGAIGDLFGFVQDGLYLPSDYVNGVDGTLKEIVPGVTPGRGISEQPGEIKFKDLNGDGRITPEDRTVIGNTLPDFYGALTNNFIYKNFELNVMLQYSVGNDVFNATKTRTENFIGSQNQSVKYLERWTPSNPTATQYSTFTSMVAASNFVEDASFLRIRNVRIGYNLPKSAFEKLNISNIKMYIAADNLAVFTKYSGYDPEVSSNIRDTKYSSVLSQGFDFGGFPRARTFTFGLNVGF